MTDPAALTVISTVRHAQTIYGAEQRYAGSLDVPLSDKGLADCARAREALAGERFDVIVTSTLTRAVHTAELIGPPGVEIVRNPLAVERRFGILEGRAWLEADHVDPPVLFVEVGGERHSVNPLGGEPFEEVWTRARHFAGQLLGDHRCRGVLVVGHGVFLQLLFGVFTGLSCIESLARAHPSTLQLDRFEFRGAEFRRHLTRSLIGRTEQDF